MMTTIISNSPRSKFESPNLAADTARLVGAAAAVAGRQSRFCKVVIGLAYARDGGTLHRCVLRQQVNPEA